MKIISKQPLRADVDQVKDAKEFQRSKVGGFLFGKSKVKALKIDYVSDGPALVLVAKVQVAKWLFFSKWETLGQAATDAITVRHIDLAVANKQLSARPVMPAPAPAATAELGRSNALRRGQRSASAPSMFQAPSTLARSNAIRRTASDPGQGEARLVAAGPNLAAASRPVLTRQASTASLVGEVGTWEEMSLGSHPPSDGSVSSSTTLSTPASSVGSLEFPKLNDQQVQEAYLRYMAHPNAYGTDIEIHALAQLTGKQIHVLDVSEDKNGVVTYGLSINGLPAALVPPASPENVIALALTGGESTSKDSNGNHLVPRSSTSNDSNGNHFVPLKDKDLSGAWNQQRLQAAAGKSLSGGACLFDSVAQQLDEDDVNHLALRAATVAWLKGNATTGDILGRPLVSEMRDAKAGGKFIVELPLPNAG